MKRFIAIVMTVLFAIGIVGTATARPAKQRTESREYLVPAAVGLSTDIPGVITGDVDFDPGAAKSVELTVKDRIAPNTIIGIEQNGRSLGVYCTTTTKAIEIEPFVTVHVFLFAGHCDGTPAFATTGVVRATFSSR